MCLLNSGLLLLNKKNKNLALLFEVEKRQIRVSKPKNNLGKKTMITEYDFLNTDWENPTLL